MLLEVKYLLGFLSDYIYRPIKLLFTNYTHPAAESHPLSPLLVATITSTCI